LQLAPSRYEGPTGIVGVLNDACRRANMVSVSFWASVPHYISAAPNPKAALALIGRLESFLHLNLDTTELQVAATDFDAKVAEAIAGNPSVASYVRQLEEQETESPAEFTEAPKGNGGNGHANGEDMQEALQQLLRQKLKKEDE
jgi:predicted ATP-grasp superfamily ATP-dependent carboligase